MYIYIYIYICLYVFIYVYAKTCIYTYRNIFPANIAPPLTDRRIAAPPRGTRLHPPARLYNPARGNIHVHIYT